MVVVQKVVIEKNEFVFYCGELVNGLYVVVVGYIKLVVLVVNGQEKVIEFFGLGEVFGEVFMFFDKFYMVEVQVFDDLFLIWIDKQDIYVVIDCDFFFVWCMLVGLLL